LLNILEHNLQLDSIKETALANWNFDKLPGNNPQNWPIGLDALNERLRDLPEFHFFNEPFDINENFKTKSRAFIFETVERIKKQNPISNDSPDVQYLVDALNAVLTIYFHTGSFPNIVIGNFS